MNDKAAWVAFAAARLQLANALLKSDQEVVCERTAQWADAMLAEYRKRWPTRKVKREQLGALVTLTSKQRAKIKLLSDEERAELLRQGREARAAVERETVLPRGRIR